MRSLRHLLVIAVVTTACTTDATTIDSRNPELQFAAGGTITHALDLVAVTGTGSGHVNVSPTAEDQGTFHVQGQVQIIGATPNHTYLVQRAPDLNVADPNCTGPWITFPTPNPGPPVTLTTSKSGAGTAHFELGVGGAFISGARFNVRFRLIDDLAAPTSVLQTDCTTVEVK